MPILCRQRTGAEQYRYGYQGEFAETDSETGKPAFELRLYDPRINRWLTTDPYGEFYSPYLSMGNNWVNTVDPDGGCTSCILSLGRTVASQEFQSGLAWVAAGQPNNWGLGGLLDGITVTGKHKIGPNTPLWDFSEQLDRFRTDTRSKIKDGSIVSAYSINGYLDSFEQNALMNGRNHVNFQDIQEVEAAKGDAALMIVPVGRVLGPAFNAFKGFRHAVTIGKGGLAPVGRGLQKHPNIARLVTSGTIKSNVLRNSVGAKALKHIMRNGTRTLKDTKNFGQVIDFKLSSGLGARFSAETNQFIGFLGRGL